MSIGMVLISVELLIMLVILLFVPADLAGACFIGFAIGESLGAAALRVAGGIFTKIADIGADLMKIVFKIKEDDARNPGVIADCVGDNAGDSVGPTADGFETYGVTGVALITFITARPSPTPSAIQVKLLVWIFVMRLVMVVTSGVAYFINEAIAKARYANATDDELRGAADQPRLARVDHLDRLHLPRVVPADPRPRRRHALWWKLATIITCGTLAGAIIPEVTKFFTSTHSRHVREVVTRQPRGRRVAQRPLRPDRRQLLRVLDRRHRHRRADGRHRLSSRSATSSATGVGQHHDRPPPSSPSAWSPSASWAWARSRSPSTATAPSPTTPRASTSCR